MNIVRHFSVGLIVTGFILMNVLFSFQEERKETFARALSSLRSTNSRPFPESVHEAGFISASLFRAAASETPVRLTYKELREYRFSRRQRSPVPPKLQALNGKPVNIAGYMIPLNEAVNVTEFMLIQYPFFGCCYSVPPEPNETVLVRLPKGKATAYINEPVRITGTFKIDETVTDGFVVSLYKIESASVIKTAANDPDVIQHKNDGGLFR
ncbi:MAG: DUF3299 domain-containing protein [Chlorobiales bacterium]|nr:DUF3299 domain-containing protein [Chlorobiales bacterium]